VSDVIGYSNLVSPLLTEIDELLNGYVFEGYQALSDYLTRPLSLLATFYLMMTGMFMALGWVKFSMGELTKRILTIALITAAVLNWALVGKYLVDLINNSIQEIGDSLVTLSPLKLNKAADLNDAMQVVLTSFTKLGTVLFNSGGFGNFGGYLDGILVWGFGYVLFACALFEIILSKVMLAILFIFTPLMALAYFFKPFHGIFNRWLGLILGAALMQIFVQAVVALAMCLCDWWMAAHEVTDALKIGNYGTLPIIIICIICIGMVHKAAQMGLYIGSAAQVMILNSSPLSMAGGLFGPPAASSQSNPASSPHSSHASSQNSAAWNQSSRDLSMHSNSNLSSWKSAGY